MNECGEINRKNCVTFKDGFKGILVESGIKPGKSVFIKDLNTHITAPTDSGIYSLYEIISSSFEHKHLGWRWAQEYDKDPKIKIGDGDVLIDEIYQIKTQKFVVFTNVSSGTKVVLENGDVLIAPGYNRTYSLCMTPCVTSDKDCTIKWEWILQKDDSEKHRCDNTKREFSPVQGCTGLTAECNAVSGERVFLGEGRFIYAPKSLKYLYYSLSKVIDNFGNVIGLKWVGKKRNRIVEG